MPDVHTQYLPVAVLVDAHDDQGALGAHSPILTGADDISASTKACSLRWYRLKSSVEKWPLRTWGTSRTRVPMRVFQCALPVPVAVALPLLRALVWRRLKVLRDLGLQDLIQRMLDQLGKPIIPLKKLLHKSAIDGNLEVGHRNSLPSGVWQRSTSRGTVALSFLMTTPF